MKEGKQAKSKIKHQNGQEHESPFKLSRLLDPEASWDKSSSVNWKSAVRLGKKMVDRLNSGIKNWMDQLGDALHWIRQVVGLICGLLWGAVPFLGAIWIVVFLVLSSGIIYGYYALILKIDEEDFGGHGALLQEGLFASFSLFLLAWILVYSLGHF